MGILNRLLGRVEKRSLTSDSYAEAFGIPTWAQHHISPHSAENLSTVLACVNAVSTAVASLPAYVYRAQAGGRVEAPMHPVARLLRQPNPHQTWPDMVEWTIGQALLHGNAVLQISWDGAGRPAALTPIPWNCVQVMSLPSGRLAYDLIQHTTPWGSTGQPKRLLEDEVLHLKDRSDDGILGRSRLSRARETFGNALSLQTFSNAQWENGATPAGAITVPANISEQALRRMKGAFENNHMGAANARRTLFLDEASKWQPFSVSPEDAEVLASRRFSVEEICRIFQVPPPIVQNYENNTFTNSAQASLWFAQLTLAPWCRKIEAEFTRSIFGAGSEFSLELDLSGLMRGDFTARWQAWQLAVQSNIFTADEVREAEGWGPRPAQDQQNGEVAA